MTGGVTAATAAVMAAIVSAGTAAAREAPRLPAPDYRAEAEGVSRDRLQKTVERLVSFRTRHTASEAFVEGEGIEAAARWIHDTMQEAAGDGRARVSFDVFIAEGSRLFKPTPARNVMMILPAGAPWARNRYVVVSGHYDSRAGDPRDFRADAPGANDDGSGTAVVIEMARVLARRSFDANVILVCVAGEEEGLLGSRHLAQRAAKAGWDVRAMITNDIVGNSMGQNGVRDAGRVRVFSEGVPTLEDAQAARRRVAIGGENDSPARQLSRHVAWVLDETFDDFEAMQVFRRDRMGRGGDHIPFLEAGYPAVRFTEVNEHFHHQHQDVGRRDGIRYGDLPEFMDFDYLARVARANVAVLASLANAPAEPLNVRLSPGVQPDTTLSWDPVPDEDVAGYEVLVRETTSPVWQETRFVAAPGARLTLAGTTVDNAFFAVRSVDKDGNRSLAVFPGGLMR